VDPSEALQAIADEIELLETQDEAPEQIILRIKETLRGSAIQVAERRDWDS
jgi:hypothetical protein